MTIFAGLLVFNFMINNLFNQEEFDTVKYPNTLNASDNAVFKAGNYIVSSDGQYIFVF